MSVISSMRDMTSDSDFPNSCVRVDRLAQSLPSLQVSFSEIRHIPPSRKWKMHDSFNCILSAFYAKLVVIMGIAFPVTDAIATSDYDSYDGFYIYLYLGSIIFLLYVYTTHFHIKAGQRTDAGERCEDILYSYPLENKKNRIRYGSFFFKMGVTGFGIGSVIYSGLQFGQYFELSSEKDCDNILKALRPLSRTIFALMQMLFIFSYNEFIDAQRNQVLSRFGLMHMIATNLCEWLHILVEETKLDIHKSAKRRLNNTSLSPVDLQFINSNAFKVTKQQYEDNYRCLTTNIMGPILLKSETYLALCTVEYSLLCAVILVVMWKNVCRNTGLREETGCRPAAKAKEKQRGCNVIYSRRQSQFSVDCAQAHKGLFSGILVLAVTIISLIMFFELVAYKEYKDLAILQVNVWEAVLFFAGTLAAIFCIIALRDVGFRAVKRDLELEHLLLLVTQCGVFMYFLFQIIGAILMGLNKGRGGIMRIITPTLALVQSSCQTVLLLDAWRRRCNTVSQIRRKPGRQLMTFLLVANVALWVVNRLKNNNSHSHPNQMDFYGILAWNVITHVSMPLVVSYRFQATVCFYEVWKHVYKFKSISRSIDEYMIM